MINKLFSNFFFQNKTMYSNQDTPTYRMGKGKVMFDFLWYHHSFRRWLRETYIIRVQHSENFSPTFV